MSIVNRRNAVIGWLTWTVGKRVVAKKAQRVIPSRNGGTGTAKKKVVTSAAMLAAVAGALAVWKAKHGDSTDHDSIASEELPPVDE
jgi:hypothetical protein